jgi:hypothetical protein
MYEDEFLEEEYEDRHVVSSADTEEYDGPSWQYWLAEEFGEEEEDN